MQKERNNGAPAALSIRSHSHIVRRKKYLDAQKTRRILLHQIGFIVLFLFTLSLPLFLNEINFTITPLTIYESTANDINDTYIRENFETSQGSATSLKVGKTAGNAEMRSVLNFNISSIPTGYTVNSATLQIFTSYSSLSTTLSVRAYKVTSPWGEEATWLNTSTSGLWTSAGGDYESSPLSEVNVTTSLNRQYNLTVTNTVRSWVNGSSVNYGIILLSAGASAGDWKEFYSSEYTTDTSLIPRLIVDYTANAPPTINNITTNSNANAPVLIGEKITFTLNWSDLDDTSVQIFVCNSTTINKSAGCAGATYCNTNMSSANPASCNYTTQGSDNRTTTFWTAVCDTGNCSTASNSTFSNNHLPNITLIQPNGGENLNQSQGNYLIKYNVSDADADKLIGNIYYGTSIGSTAGILALGLNLTTNCTDADSTTSTSNNCTYSWNTTELYGSYFLTIIINDTYATRNTSSNSSFSVVSLIDTTAPNITSPWINEPAITSGALIKVYVNVSDPNVHTVWFSLNTTPMQNRTMSNTSASEFNGTFTAPAVGAYKLIAYANDTIGNSNQSSALTFNVTKPNASVQKPSLPALSVPYTTIRVSSSLNATSNIRDANAYLYVPDGFMFLSGYPQQTTVKNYSSGEANISDWFVSTPLAENNYTLNVTYTDYYSNTWNSSRAYIMVNSSSSTPAYTVEITGYPEVETTQSYFVQTNFKSNGVNTAADSAKITLYDSLGNVVAGPASMNNPSIGSYNYSYTIGASVNEGQWQTIANVTRGSVSYYASQYWKVVGGPFDVRNITIDNPAINALQISVTTENTGGATKDLTLMWNLTRVDTGEVLDSGSDTFAVFPASTRVWAISPSTIYVGQVKIAFLGTYSGTEKAGAFKIFSTTPASVSSGSTGSGGGGGGSGGTTTVSTKEDPSVKEYDALLRVDSEVYATKSIKKTITLEVENTGKKDLNNIRLFIENIPTESYSITPEKIQKLKPGKRESIAITLLAEKLTEKNNVTYKVRSDEIERVVYGIITVLNTRDFLLKEIGRLQAELSQLTLGINSKKLSGKYFECEKFVRAASGNIEKEEYIDSKINIEKADTCVTELKKLLSKSFEIPSSVWWTAGIIAAILLIGAMLFLLYRIYRRTNVISVLGNDFKSSAKPRVSGKKSPKSEYFDKKLSEIEEKLGES